MLSNIVHEGKVILNTGSNQIIFDESYIYELFDKGDFAGVCEEFLRVIQELQNYVFYVRDFHLVFFLNRFLSTFFWIVSNAKFKIPNAYYERMVRANPYIASLARISDFRTTDVPLSIITRQEENFIKFLILANPCNRYDYGVDEIFDIQPYLASRWYYALFSQTHFLNDAYAEARAKNLLKVVNDKLVHFSQDSIVSFLTTNWSPEHDYLFKKSLNNALAKALEDFDLSKKVNKKKIAVISDKWFPSAVFNSISPMIKELAGDYELVLVHFNDNVTADITMFSHQIKLPMDDKAETVKLLTELDFYTIIYPDVGMNSESILLATKRIAPIQICMYGHPVSTYSHEMDYYIVGSEVEKLELAEQNYTERLVVVPGIGAQTVWPSYEPKGHVKSDSNEIIIACSWASSKMNHSMLKILRTIIERSDKKVRFLFFPNWGARNYNGYLSIAQLLEEGLGPEHVAVYPDTGVINEYHEKLEIADFAIDSYPFGGFNTIVDVLNQNKPVISWEGDHAYGRFASAILRKIGAGHNVATSRAEYIGKIVELVNNPSKLEEEKKFLQDNNTKEKLMNLTDCKAFKNAIDLLIENHEKYKTEGSQAPIIIERS